jgi:MinD-like ATPase involved in chromosome partitioning or flagellar assembly
MTDERWVVLGLGHPRADWFSNVAKWATTAAIPVDFVKCVSANEARVRLGSGRAYSALLVGADVSGFDRDLAESARNSGSSVIVVSPPSHREWAELGVAAVLTPDFDREKLVSTLHEHARAVARVSSLPSVDAVEPTHSRKGRLIAVTGPGGTGSSVAAMSVAQAFAAESAESGSVLLADLRLDAELAMLHDAREVVPGVQELTEAHRGGRLAADQVRSLCFDALGRGYHLLLGLRSHRDWTAIRPRAFAASLDGLLSTYRLVVADIDADLEGEESTGSVDVEDRNVMARRSAACADVIVVVGNPTTKGIHALLRVARHLHRSGVASERLVPVFTRAARNPRRRAEAVRALATLVDTEPGLGGMGNPVFLTERNDVESSIRDGERLAVQLGRPLHAELLRRLDLVDPPSTADSGGSGDPRPQPVPVGSLGSWAEEVG